MHEKGQQYESMIKKFLSKKLKEHVIGVDRIKAIIIAAAQFSESVQDDQTLMQAIQTLEQQFAELHELVQNLYYEQLSVARKQLEAKVIEISSELMLEDMEKAQEILHFVDNPQVGLNDFYQKYPEYNS